MGLTKAQKAEREQAQKRSEATKRGWETKRAKQQAAQQGAQSVNYHHVVGAPQSTVTYATTEWVNTKSQYGLTTQKAISIEQLSLRVGASIGSLLQRVRYKLYGSESPNPTNPEKVYSPSSLIGAQERTADNLEDCLKLLEEFDKIEEEML